MTSSTTGAYEATGTAEAAGLEELEEVEEEEVTAGLAGAALTFASGAFHAANIPTARIAAASPPVRMDLFCMLRITSNS
jgi:hypothetical protein